MGGSLYLRPAEMKIRAQIESVTLVYGKMSLCFRKHKIFVVWKITGHTHPEEMIYP